MGNSDKNTQKEFTPFQFVIKSVDEHIDVSLKQNIDNHQIGFIHGLLITRNSCARLLEAEKLELKEAFETAKNNPKTDFEDWFKEKYENKEYEELSVELKPTESEVEILERLTKDESEELLNFIPKPKRYLIFFMYMLMHFVVYMVATVAYIVTLQFKKLSRLPKSAEETKNFFKKKLKL